MLDEVLLVLCLGIAGADSLLMPISTFHTDGVPLMIPCMVWYSLSPHLRSQPTKRGRHTLQRICSPGHLLSTIPLILLSSESLLLSCEHFVQSG